MRTTQKEKVVVRKSGRGSGTKANGDAIFIRHDAGTFDVNEFCKSFQLKRDAFTRMTGYSPRAVAGWAGGQRVSQSSIQRLTEINRLCEALSKVVKSESVGAWLQRPNNAFDGSTPIQVIERGEADRLWRMIYRLESGEPG